MPGAAAAVAASSAIATAVTSATFVAIGSGTFASLVFANVVGAIVAIGVNLAIATAIGALANLLSSRPKIPGTSSIASSASSRTLTIRQPISAHRVIYGEVRVSGVLTFIESTDDNDKLHQLITIAGHPVSEIGEVYVDGEPVTLNSSGSVTSGVYAKSGSKDRIIIIKGLGTVSGDADLNSALTSNTTGWTANHKQTGRAKAYVQFIHDPEIFIGSLPAISFRVKGKPVFDPRDSLTKYSNNPVLCLRDYLLDIDFGLGESALRVGPSFLSAINVSEELVEVDVTRDFTAEPLDNTITLSSAAPRFVVSDLVTLDTDGTLPGGLSLSTNYFLIPVTDIDFKLALSKENAAAGVAVNITDAGSGTHSLTRQYLETFTANESTNKISLADRVPGLETVDAVEVSTTGTLPGGLAPATEYFYIRETNTSGLLALSYADALSGMAIDITSTGSGTHTLHRKSEPRYTSNGSFDTDQTPEEIIRQLLSASNGSLVYQTGFWNTYVSFQPPTLDAIDESDLDGTIQVQTLISKRDLFNGVKGQFSSVDKDFMPTDFPAITNSTYLDEDGGERIWADVDLPFTTSSSMAQRISKIQLEKVRQQISVVLFCNLKAIRFQAGATIKINNTRFGWVEKVFSIENWSFAIRRGSGDRAPQLGIDMFCRETAPEIYDWNSGEETRTDIAPNTILPNPFVVLPPTGLVAIEELYIARQGGGVKARARLTWTASTDTFVVSYEVQHKFITDLAFEAEGAVRNTNFVLEDLTPGEYMFRVFSVNTLGVKSVDFIEQTLEILGLLAPPEALQNMTISTIGGLAIIRWAQSVDLDVREGGKIVFRHSNLIGGPTWNESVSIGDAIPGTETVAILPLKPGTYLGRAIDGSLVSGPVVSVETTQATALEYTNLNTISEHITFPGAKTNLEVVSDNLQLALLPIHTFDIFSEDSFATGMAFNNDGMKMFMVGRANDSVYEYDLTTPYSLASGASYSGFSFVIAEDSGPQEVIFNDDGMKMFVLGGTTATIYEYDLTTPYSLQAGVSYSGFSFSVSGEDTIPSGLTFNDDGTKMFLVGKQSKRAHEYTLDTAYSLQSGVNYTGFSAQVSLFSPFLTGITFNNDGTSLFVVGDLTSIVQEYLLENPYSLEFGATLSGLLFDVANEAPSPQGLLFNDDGTKFFIVCGNTDNIYQYNIPSPYRPVRGVIPDGEYIFDGAFDFGVVTRVRLTVLIQALVVNIADDIDSRQENIDDWVDFDGTESADADVKIFVRHTDDDPGGSPVFSEYQRLDSGEFEARAFEFKAEFTSGDLNFNILVSQLTITADEVA